MIKFLDLQKVNAQYADELKQAAAEVIDSGWFLMGTRVSAFEKQFANYIGVKHTISCANGLDALRLILKGYMELGLMQEGDEVIVPANTFIASILAITGNRLKPVLVEPDIQTYNINISLIERHISRKTKAIMVVHLYGRACWSQLLEIIAQKYNLIIIEDNAQAVGAYYFYNSGEKKRTGSLGNAAGNSFYPGKNLGALGDSGAVTTNDETLADVIRAISNYGSATKYVNKYNGLNSRMDEMQAAFLSIKLKYLNAENKTRQIIADCYNRNINNRKIILPPPERNQNSHVQHLYVIRTIERERLKTYLADNNIQSLIHYPIPPHKQECFKSWNYLSFPITEKIHQEVLTLPVSPVMSNEEVEEVVNSVNKFK